MIFIVTILLLAADFYYLKNIAGRRLVGLRWWNEVDPATGDSHWVFETSEPGTKDINATDSRFFWLAIYVQPLLWVGLALLVIIRLRFIWLPLVGAWDPFLSLCSRPSPARQRRAPPFGPVLGCGGGEHLADDRPQQSPSSSLSPTPSPSRAVTSSARRPTWPAPPCHPATSPALSRRAWSGACSGGRCRAVKGNEGAATSESTRLRLRRGLRDGTERWP